MDSFYDAPRMAPKPTPLEKIFVSPLVPEVSLLATTKTCFSNENCLGYHAGQRNTQVLLNNKENTYHVFGGANSTSLSLLRKQVRFESPVRGIDQPDPLRCITSNDIHKLSQNGSTRETPPFLPSEKQDFNGKTFQQIYMSNIPSRHLDLSIIDNDNSSKKCSNSFKTDVSNACDKIDTSRLIPKGTVVNKIHDESQIVNDCKSVPHTYREFLDLQNKVRKQTDKCRKMQSDNSVTDILNYSRQNRSPHTQREISKSNRFEKSPVSKDIDSMNSEQRFENVCNDSKFADFKLNTQLCAPNAGGERQSITGQRCDSNTQTSGVCTEKDDTKIVERSSQKNDSNEPTVKDLLKIIQQQNEQLLLLQKQVASLIERSEPQKCIETCPKSTTHCTEKYVTSTQHEYCAPEPVSTPKKGPLSKFSIDMMTSFEVSFRHQAADKFRKRLQNNFVNQEPEITEISETTSANSHLGNNVAGSYDYRNVDSSLHLQEPLEIREQLPSPEPSININMTDYDGSDDETDSQPDVQADIYSNLMNQIGKFLKNAQVQSTNGFCQIPNDEGTFDSTDKNKDRTMSKVKEATLRHLQSIGINIENVDNNDSLQTSDSCSYSPTEISFAVKQLLMKYLPNDYLSKVQQNTEVPQLVPKFSADLIPERPEFSFASVQYMKKYNLLASNKGCPKQAEFKGLPEPEDLDNQRILDISTLKHQPKLL